VERLAAKGIAPDRIARIHGPVGLDIGAAVPAEIALSILAECTQVLRRG
jgi:xanthine dehydrogenase accessory factor